MRILIILLLSLCSSNPFVKETDFLCEKTIRISYKETVKQTEGFSLDIKNVSKDEIFIHYPGYKPIEKKKGDEWVKVKILYCPCGQNCDAPPQKKILNPGQKYRVYWNLLEGWCEENLNGGIPKTIEKKVESGRYRISLFYSQGNEEKVTIIKEFEIVE